MFVTVLDLQNYTSVKVENPEERLQPFLDSALEIIQNHIGYDLEINFTKEYVQGFGDNKLKLKHRPVNLVYSVADIENPDEPLYEAVNSNGGTDYIIQDEFVSFINNVVFPKKQLAVEYVYGYGLLDFAANVFGGGDASTSDFPITAFGGEAEDFTIFYTIHGGGANNIGVIETIIPSIFKQTQLRIASLLYQEADQNIGVTSKSFGDSGARTFVNFTNFDKYLSVLSKFRLVMI
jgi:hypothetical protein